MTDYDAVGGLHAIYPILSGRYDPCSVTSEFLEWKWSLMILEDSINAEPDTFLSTYVTVSSVV